jgi:hypothetical protein
MREVETPEQLEWILSKAYDVVEVRDEIYSNYLKMSSLKSTRDEANRIGGRVRNIGMIILRFVLSVGTLVVLIGQFTGDITKAIVLGLILGAIATAIMTAVQSAQYNAKAGEANFKNTVVRISTDQLEDKARKLSNSLWCAEIIPIAYRNKQAIEIMIAALRNSRADNWKECLDVYDRECEKESMRRYQQEQLALSKEAASNSKWAAAGAWASFGAILWK